MGILALTEDNGMTTRTHSMDADVPRDSDHSNFNAYLFDSSI